MRAKAKKSRSAGNRGPTRTRLVRERTHDPYKSRSKAAKGAVCTQCAAVYRNGRWRWTAKPPKARAIHCPACRRRLDGYPAGYLTLAGHFSKVERQELIRLARNVAASESSDHPLARLIATKQRTDAIEITTTDTRLPKQIGEAIRRAFRGRLTVHYNRAEYLVRVQWTPASAGTESGS